jgi:hypothetical protein
VGRSGFSLSSLSRCSVAGLGWQSLSRRQLLIHLGAGLQMTSLSFLIGAAGTQARAATKGLARERKTAPIADRWLETWIEEWHKRPKAPGGTLHLSRFKDPMYFLTKPISWKPNEGQGLAAVEVATGFVTDFASIPRVFWSALRPDGEYTYPAIIHDYLYWTQTRPRRQADQIFRFAMQDFSIPSVTSFTIYEAVRRFWGKRLE